jgi:hypothetical protein
MTHEWHTIFANFFLFFSFFVFVFLLYISLVTGSVEGHFTDFFDKIASTNEKYGPFDMLLCTGNFFATDTPSTTDDLIHGKVKGKSNPTLFIKKKKSNYLHLF